MTRNENIPVIGLPDEGRLKRAFNQILDAAGFDKKISHDEVSGLILDRLQVLPPIPFETNKQVEILGDLLDNSIQFGVVGLDKQVEFSLANEAEDIVVSSRLGLAQCSLWFAAPDPEIFKDFADLERTTIATSYPEILKAALAERNIDLTRTNIVERRGKIERCVRRGMADVAFDIVESGSTLAKNDLSPLFNKKVMDSYAIVVEQSDLSSSQSSIAREFARRISAASPLVSGHYPTAFGCPPANASKLISPPAAPSGFVPIQSLVA